MKEGKVVVGRDISSKEASKDTIKVNKTLEKIRIRKIRTLQDR